MPIDDPLSKVASLNIFIFFNIIIKSPSLTAVIFQFADKSFDIVLDKGGLDALMEPELGPTLGTQYVSEVS